MSQQFTPEIQWQFSGFWASVYPMQQSADNLKIIYSLI